MPVSHRSQEAVMTYYMNTEEAINCYRIRSFRNKKRRQRELMLHIMILAVVLFCAAVITTLLITKFESSAESNDSDIKEYTSVMVGYGEDLNDIADRYRDPVYYSDRASLVKEIRNINHISDRSDVNPGDYVIVPYYVRQDS